MLLPHDTDCYMQVRPMLASLHSTCAYWHMPERSVEVVVASIAAEAADTADTAAVDNDSCYYLST